MKKLILLFILFDIANATKQSFSQVYKSLYGNSTTVWNTDLGYCDSECTDSVSITGDTVIGIVSYKKIHGNDINNGLGFLRQDTVLGKAWFRNTFNNNEYLVMDLSLSVADTFVIYDFFDPPYTIYVDSVYFKNGLKHVRFNYWISMCGQIEKLTFIEGSGTNSGIAYLPTAGGSGALNYYLLCHFKDGIRACGNVFYNDACFVCYVGVNEIRNNLSFFISPNPSSGIFTLSSSEKISSIEITDVLGNCILKSTIKNQKSEINLSSQPKGIYFLKVQNENANFGVKKIIIQ